MGGAGENGTRGCGAPLFVNAGKPASRYRVFAIGEAQFYTRVSQGGRHHVYLREIGVPIATGFLRMMLKIILSN